jgi:hypothetical protein
MKNHVNLLPLEIRRLSLAAKLVNNWYLFSVLVVVTGLLAVIPYRANQRSLDHLIAEMSPVALKSMSYESQLQDIHSHINRLDQLVLTHNKMRGKHPPLAALSVLSNFAARHRNQVQLISVTYNSRYFPTLNELPLHIAQLADTNEEDSVVVPIDTNASHGDLTIKAKLAQPSLATQLLASLKDSKLFRDVQLAKHTADREIDAYSSLIEITCKF